MWGVGGLISLRCVGLVAKDATRWRHKVSSAWNGVDSFIRCPFAVLSACWRQVNIPAAPAMAGPVLHRVPSSLCQRHQEHRLALGAGGVVSSREGRFCLRSSGRVRTYLTVSISHLRTTFCVLQVTSPLWSFLGGIDSSLVVSSLALSRKR